MDLFLLRGEEGGSSERSENFLSSLGAANSGPTGLFFLRRGGRESVFDLILGCGRREGRDFPYKGIGGLYFFGGGLFQVGAGRGFAVIVLLCSAAINLEFFFFILDSNA